MLSAKRESHQAEVVTGVHQPFRYTSVEPVPAVETYVVEVGKVAEGGGDRTFQPVIGQFQETKMGQVAQLVGDFTCKEVICEI